MPNAIHGVDELKAYIDGIMARTEHHAGNVGAIALALAGAIIWKKDGEPITVHKGRSMAHGTVLWTKIGGRKFAFSYNHEDQTIEMREGSINGRTLHSFDNKTPITQIQAIFRAL